MHRAPQEPLTGGAFPVRAEQSRSVQLIRFTIHPDRRSQLVASAQSPGTSRPWPEGTLLVELEDGDWLAICISKGERPVEESACVGLAEGISGDESGVIVAVAAHGGDPDGARRRPGRDPGAFDDEDPRRAARSRAQVMPGAPGQQHISHDEEYQECSDDN